MKKLIQKIKKKIKRWLAHKIGCYTIDEIPPRNYTIVNRPAKCITLNLAVSTYTELFETEMGLNFVKLRIKEALHDFALKELPKCMSYVITPSPAGPYRIVRCQLDVVPPINGESEKSLADLLSEKESNNES